MPKPSKRHLGQPAERKMANYHLTPVSVEAIRRAKLMERPEGESREEWFARMVCFAGNGRWTRFLQDRLESAR